MLARRWGLWDAAGAVVVFVTKKQNSDLLAGNLRASGYVDGSLR